MNRRNFLKAVLATTAAAPLAMCGGPAYTATELPMPHGWTELFPWQRRFVELVKSGQNVRLSGAARSGKSHVMEHIARSGILPHMSHTMDAGRVLEIRQHDGPIDVEACFSMVKYLFTEEGECVSKMFVLLTRPSGSRILSQHSGQQHTHLDRS